MGKGILRRLFAIDILAVSDALNLHNLRVAEYLVNNAAISDADAMRVL